MIPMIGTRYSVTWIVPIAVFLNPWKPSGSP